MTEKIEWPHLTEAKPHVHTAEGCVTPVLVIILSSMIMDDSITRVLQTAVRVLGLKDVDEAVARCLIPALRCTADGLEASRPNNPNRQEDSNRVLDAYLKPTVGGVQ